MQKRNPQVENYTGVYKDIWLPKILQQHYFVCVCLKAPHRMKPYELLPAQHRYNSNNGTLLSSGQTVTENRGGMEDTQRSPCIFRELK